MKVVIDTNVLISGLISPDGPPSRIVNLWITGKVKVYVSSEIIEEYMSVLLRPKFSRLGSPQERYDLITQLMELDNTIIVYPEFELNVIAEDPDDNKFLACAVEANAEVLISGDEHLLNLEKYQEITILVPTEFLQNYY